MESSNATWNISHYRVLEKIGAGGMGEVHLAEDTLLNRKVAIKLLPAASITDIQAKKRLIREAQAAAALDHPNICGILEIGEDDGRSFIVMQYIDGETLNDRIKKGSLELTEAIGIAIQIADALSEAATRGIVHRDIKPQNIMITNRGQAKLMDFGLARMTQPKSLVETEAETKTLLTEPGLLLGTVSYMSPEQVNGETLDARSDIFSFGSVLYEIVTSKPPFAADSAAATFSSILTREPPPVARYSSEAPAELQWVISKSLRKNKEERYQTAKELLSDLKAIKHRMDLEAESRRADPQNRTLPQMASADRTTPQQPTHSGAIVFDKTTEASGDKHSKITTAFILATSLIGISVVGFVLYGLITKNESKRLAPFQEIRLQRLTTTSKAKLATISPDGQYVVYALGEPGLQSISLAQISNKSNIQIVPPTDVNYEALVFSGDSNYIYYVVIEKNNQLRVLYQMPKLGGSAKRLITDIDSLITFSPDRKRIAFCRFVPARGESTLVLANVDGTSEQQLTARPGDLGFAQADEGTGPAWSPSNDTIICPALVDASTRQMGLIEVDSKNGTQKHISSQKWASIGSVAWVREGTGLLIAAKDQPTAPMQIWYLSYPAGDVRRITNDLSDYRHVTLTADASMMCAVQTDRVSSIWVVPNGEPTRVRPLTSGKFDGVSGLSWTPDGRIVYSSIQGGTSDIWMVNSDGSNQKQLTRDTGNNEEPSVSGDGRYIVFSSDRSGASHIWRIETDGGNPKELTKGSYDFRPQSSQDSRWVAYANTSSGKPSVWKIGIEGGEAIRLTNIFTGRPGISADGRYVACFYLVEEQINTTSKFAIISFDNGQLIRLLDFPSSADALFRWASDGRAVMYIDTRSGISNIWSQPVQGGQPRQLTQFTSDRIFWFDWSHDGKNLALARGIETNDVVIISALNERR
jgi:serine/threonine protein kinase